MQSPYRARKSYRRTASGCSVPVRNEPHEPRELSLKLHGSVRSDSDRSRASLVAVYDPRKTHHLDVPLEIC
eukprot:scaffold48187_cov20-Tisochrysis_lutea.AAC.1